MPPWTTGPGASPPSRHRSTRTPAPLPIASGSRITSTLKRRNYASQTRACQFFRSVPSLDPVHSCGHAEHTHEGASSLLVAGCHGPPLLEPRPESLDAVAVLI